MPKFHGTLTSKCTSMSGALILPVSNMSWQYLAGFLDGEGCFKSYRNGGRIARPRITVGQKDREVLDRIQEFLGTSNAVTLSRDCYYLQYNRLSVVLYILTGIFPYLIVKRRDAQAILDVFGADTIGV